MLVSSVRLSMEMDFQAQVMLIGKDFQVYEMMEFVPTDYPIIKTTLFPMTSKMGGD